MKTEPPIKDFFKESTEPDTVLYFVVVPLERPVLWSILQEMHAVCNSLTLDQCYRVLWSTLSQALMDGEEFEHGGGGGGFGGRGGGGGSPGGGGGGGGQSPLEDLGF